jgi:hypothetical protein
MRPLNRLAARFVAAISLGRDMPDLDVSSEKVSIALAAALRLFPLGHVVATSGAVDLLDRCGINANMLLARHECGDWGVVCAADAAANNQALLDGERLLSAYEVGQRKERLWIVTEHDRSVTTLLLPEEY